MANITLTGPAEKIRAAKVVAAQRDTSVSALFFDFIDSIGGDTTPREVLWEQELAKMDAGLLRVGPVAWARDDLHDRSL
jgi:hypothetical protein